MSPSVRACTCIESSFCDHINSEYFENGVIWIGKQIDKHEVGNSSFAAYQFEEEELIEGAFILRNSLSVPKDSSGFTYNNTDSTIWVIGGSQASCFEHYPKGRILFAITYLDGVEGQGIFPVGYTSSLCSIDFMPINDQDEVHDFIDDIEQRSTLTLDEIRDVIDRGCREELTFWY